MPRSVTLFTGQFADIPLEELCAKAVSWGYDGLELACWGDHVDVTRAAKEKKYAKSRKEMLADFGLELHAISNHLAGQLVLDPNDDARSDTLAPKECRGNPSKKRAWAIQQMKDTARAAKNIGVKVVIGFTGSSTWHMFYAFPPMSEKLIEAGYSYFAKIWNPIFDVYDQCGVKFALEVHAGEVAYDVTTARRALKAVNNRKTFGFNMDPSHLHWQMVDPVVFLRAFPKRIYHVHIKDACLTLDGESSILCSYLNFGQPGRGWDFRTPGRGGVDFEEIIRELNHMNYKGPLSVEWEDAAMDREFGAQEACEFTRALDFPKSDRVFDEAFGE